MLELKFKSEKGFTLVELLMAVAILAVVLTSYLSTLVMSSIQSDSSGNLSAALVSAQTQVEEIRNSSYDTIVSTYNGQAFSPAAPDGATGALVVTEIGDDDASELLQVTATVSWTNRDSRALDTSVTVYVANK